MARPGLTRHPKFSRLCLMLGEPPAHALGHLEMLWAVCYETGEPEIGDTVDIEAAAGWDGKPGELCKALLECGGKGRAGFIEPATTDPDRFQIHDLYDHCPEYVRKRMDREAARRVVGKSLSEIRAEAARKRWDAKQTDANGGQLHNGECKRQSLAPSEDANGTPPAPAPAPKDKSARRKFIKPTLEEVAAYSQERTNKIDPQYFLDYHEARGWALKGGQHVKDWKAVMRTWERNGFASGNGAASKPAVEPPPAKRIN